MSQAPDATNGLKPNPIFKAGHEKLTAGGKARALTSIVGYVGTVGEHQVQLFERLQLNSYFLIDKTDILHHEQTDPHSESSPTRLYIDPNAKLTFTSELKFRVKASSYKELCSRSRLASVGGPVPACPNGETHGPATDDCPCGKCSKGFCPCPGQPVDPRSFLYSPFPLLDERMAHELGIEFHEG